jgi:hypothetical protein
VNVFALAGESQRRVRGLIEARGCELVYLPRYSRT